MESSAQIAANRVNAEFSTGPVTPEGKLNSSQNARKHGLTAKGIIVLPGHELDFQSMQSNLEDELHPASELEHVLFNKILEASWNLHRSRPAQADPYALNPPINPLL